MARPEAEAAVRPRGRWRRPGGSARRRGAGTRARCPARCPRRAISTCAPRRRQAARCTRPPSGVNLMAFESRFQTTCCRRSGSPETGPASGSSSVSSADAPWPPRPGATASRAASIDRGQVHRAHVEPQLAGDDARDVEDVLDELGLRARVALDGLDGARHGRRVELARSRSMWAQPDDRVERRAQLVGERGQELVLEPVRLLQPLVQRRTDAST